MSMVINHNLMAMNAARNLSTVFNRLATSTQRLSSGLRINSAADDAAGLAIREIMRADIAVLNQGLRNAADAISMIQTAEGALSVIDEKLIRMKELAEQAATGTYTTVQREIMDSEYQAMAAEIDRIANATDFNGIKLLDGSITTAHQGSGLKIHFGAGNDSAEDYYFISIADARATVETGLQVGGGRGDNSIITTSGTGVSTTTGALFTSAGAAATYDEYAGFWYNRTGSASSTAAANPSYLVGFYQATNGNDSLNDLVNNINGGTAGRVGFGFSSATGTQVIAAANSSTTTYNVTIGDTTAAFAFGTSGAAAVTGAPTFVFDVSGVADIAADFTSAWNAQAAADTYAIRVAGTNNVLFFEKDPANGDPTLTALDSSGTASSFYFYNVDTGVSAATNLNFGMDDESWVTASVYQDTNGNYQLRVEGNDYGENFDVSSQNIGTYLTNEDAWAGPLGALGTYEQTQTAAVGPYWDGAHITTQSHAQEALDQLDSAILKKDGTRADLGALQNRLENTMTNLSIQAENLQAAESRISDVDVATEMTEFTRNNIMAQASTSMLAQANSLAQLALSLLG